MRVTLLSAVSRRRVGWINLLCCDGYKGLSCINGSKCEVYVVIITTPEQLVILRSVIEAIKVADPLLPQYMYYFLKITPTISQEFVKAMLDTSQIQEIIDALWRIVLNQYQQ